MAPICYNIDEIISAISAVLAGKCVTMSKTNDKIITNYILIIQFNHYRSLSNVIQVSILFNVLRKIYAFRRKYRRDA